MSLQNKSPSMLIKNLNPISCMSCLYCCGWDVTGERNRCKCVNLGWIWEKSACNDYVDFQLEMKYDKEKECLNQTLKK